MNTIQIRPPAPPATFSLHAFLETSEHLLTDSEREQIAALDAKFNRFHEQLEDCNHHAAKSEVLALRAAFIASPSEENCDKLAAEEMSIENLKLHYDGVRGAVKAARLAWAQSDVFNVVATVIARVVAAIEAQVQQDSAPLKESAERCGVPFRTDCVCAAALAFAAELRNKAVQLPEGFLGQTMRASAMIEGVA